MIITVYTDGSADNAKGTGGYGIVIYAKVNGVNRMKKHVSPKYQDTTNNRMELKAILKAMQLIDPGHKIDIHSDSKYCIDGINLWLPNWVKTGKVMEKQNSDLWLKAAILIKKHRKEKSTLHFIWIRGHNGNGLNEMADKLANEARLQIGGGISCKVNN